MPTGLLVRLQHDAVAEGATLAVVDTERAHNKLADIIADTSRRQDLDPVAQADVRRWSREPSSRARDGVPARAFPPTPGHEAGRLAQRDFDLGRGFGLLTGGGPPAAVTACC
jgi:hypothetical protein